MTNETFVLDNELTTQTIVEVRHTAAIILAKL